MTSRSRRRRALAGSLLLALAAAGCGAGTSGAPAAAPATTAVGAAAIRPQGAKFLAEFQTTVDRSGRFSGLDEFCSAPGPTPESPRATGPGISADAVTVVHLRTKLEELEKIGFGLPVGDVRDMFDTFVNIVNTRCGGVHGRRLDLKLVETNPLSPNVDQDRVNACKAAVDMKAVFALSSSGFYGSGVGCLTADHDTVLVTTDGQPDTAYQQASGRLYSLSFGADDQLRIMARELGRAKVLEGRRVGVVLSDAPGQQETVRNGLLDVLRDEFKVDVTRVDVIGCGGATTCAGGVEAAAQGIVKDRIDVLFPLLNVVSLPPFLAQLAKAGVQPGQIKMYNTDFNNQASEIVASKVAELGGNDAGRIYDGATLLDDAPGGGYRVAGSTPGKFSEMCNREYAQASALHRSFNPADEIESNGYGMVSTVCAEVRMMVRALDLAGPNPSRADVAAAMQKLGPVDLGYGIPGTIGPAKFAAPDAVTSIRFYAPCPSPTKSKGGACIMPLAPTRAVER